MRGSYLLNSNPVINHLPSCNGENFVGVFESPVVSVCSDRGWLRTEILSRFPRDFHCFYSKSAKLQAKYACFNL